MYIMRYKKSNKYITFIYGTDNQILLYKRTIKTYNL